MPIPPEQDLLDLIEAGEPFTATSADGAFTVRVDAWVPYVATAIHAGHELRPDLSKRCLLTPEERRQEEDPYTGDLIASLPITVVCHDSRYEYDLNRPLARCIYETAWGKPVWRRAVTRTQRARSHAKHRTFYRVLDALVTAVETRFGAALVFDVHSFNLARHGEAAPVFNLGTSQIDLARWDRVIERLRERLAGIDLAPRTVTALCDVVFQGRGYLIAHINANHADTLVVPTEVAKVFMNEVSGELYPLVMEQLAAGFKHALSDTAAFFARRHTARRKARRHDMLSTGIDPVLQALDRDLARLVKGAETLLYVSPVNVTSQRRAFLKRGILPTFHYRPLAHDPYRFRARLYNLPVDTLADPDLQLLYHTVIDSLAARMDLITSVGTDRFVYNSLRYYGEPDAQDVANARFILHATATLPPPAPRTISAGDAATRLAVQAAAWNLPCKVELSRRIVARALVNNTRKTLVINRDARFSEGELQALAHHELGVHMSTTLNGREQPLRIFSLGLPVNTLTQEGLAILAEYLSGHLTLDRLRGLALRVMAIDLMLRHSDFPHTVQVLHEEHGMAREAAFDLAVRVYRGGGLTKDYLYLRGIREIFALWQTRPLDNLFVGKTNHTWLRLIDELRARELVTPPIHVPPIFSTPGTPDPVVEFVIRSIQAPRRTVG
ncbi:MAG: flavohemoglobin expression-modulating QEGLA motif protein [Candidatus Krumholzibacteriia bacterium]